MALWGNRDSKTAAGTVSITSGGVVTGSGTSFTTRAKVGNYIRVGTTDYVIVKINSNTSAVVTSGVNGGAIATQSGASYTLSEKPAYVAKAESHDNGFGSSGDATKVFGVDAAETSAGGDDVSEIALVNPGTGYTEAPAVTFDSGAQTATTTISGGSVTAVTITGEGSYSAPPVVTIAKARRTIATTAVNTTAETITYTGHGMPTGEALVYNKVGGGTAIGGLTTGHTYYAIAVDSDTFKLAASAADAANGTAINLTGTGNSSQYFELSGSVRATATAALGSGPGGTQVTHAGWVRRTVGTGGRAGRVFYETLVASGSLTGDQADDVQFHDV